VSERFPESKRAIERERNERGERGYETVGTTLKRGRLQKDMSLAEVSRVTRIPAHTLEKIEDDHFDDLPGEVFAKGFLKAYAQAVGVDAKDILARYSASRRVATVTPLPVTSPVQAAREGQGRRFGVAIALVLLLILFTLAISIVLKPRGRDVPHELSEHAPATSSLRTT
jgi:cytoskeletal protein RodZ